MPFAWCEGIEDATAPPFNRQERILGSDFLAEVLKTADAGLRITLNRSLRSGEALMISINTDATVSICLKAFQGVMTSPV